MPRTTAEASVLNRLPTVTVVICAYDEGRWDLLVKAVQSLSDQIHPPDQCVVVIDHNDRLFRRARAEFVDAVVVANQQERGLSGASNTGTAHAMTEVVCFLDDDAQAEEGWVRSLLINYGDPQVVGTSGLALPLWPDGRRPRWFPPEFDWVVGCSYRGLPTHVAPIRNPIGCSMSLRRALLESVGGFDTTVGQVGASLLRCDETEFALRARQRRAGIEFLHVPDAVVRHHVPPGRAEFRYFLRRCYTEGIAKHQLSDRAGRKHALSSERAYTSQVLPQAVARGIADTGRGDPMGLARAGTVILGLLVTTAGYLRSAAASALRSKGRSRSPARRNTVS